MATIQKNIQVQNVQDFMHIQDLLYLCLAKWHWFVISLAVCLGTAVWYLLTTPPVYSSSASMLIKDDSKGSSASGDAGAFSDLGLFTTNSNINDEMGTLRSPDLMREVVSRLHLDMDYKVSGRFYRKTVYGRQLPVSVSIGGLSEDASLSFTLQLSADGKVAISDVVRGGESVSMPDLTGTLNDTIRSGIGNIVVSPTSSYTENVATKLYVSHLPFGSAVSACSSRLGVSRNDDKSNIITLSFNDVSTQRAEDVLNTLIAVYNENWISDKNRVTISTSQFIDDRLGVIENELGNVDDDISSFKSEHLLPDVQAAASMYMAQASEAESSIRDLNNQVYMARYIRNNLTGGGNTFRLLPTNSGINDANLSSQITAYNSQLLDRNSLVAHSSEKNPMVVEMDSVLSALRSALLTSIDNQLVALNAQINSLQGISGQATSQIASNPQQAKYLLSVERQQKVKESLYLFLLQKREENELSQAFTAYNTRIIAMPSDSSAPIAPVKKNILLVAFALGMFLPLAVIFMRESTNTRVRGRKDLDGVTVPFIGEIPLYIKRKKTFGRKPKDVKAVVVKEGSRDIINEAFRVLRTNLEFMSGKEMSSSVIAVTSFNPGSGKSFLTLNIAVSLAIKGKRVLVIDGDLRHGSASQYVGSPAKGFSDYLGGKVDSLDEIIVTDPKHEYLDVLPVGTNPPNPTELLFSERLKQTIDTARDRYDYVLIDCPPIEIVADTQIIDKLVDRTVFVVRAGLLDRSMLAELEKLYDEKKYRNMSMILNGTEGSGNRYGYKYGYRYGYHYGYGYGYHYGSDKKRGG